MRSSPVACSKNYSHSWSDDRRPQAGSRRRILNISRNFPGGDAMQITLRKFSCLALAGAALAAAAPPNVLRARQEAARTPLHHGRSGKDAVGDAARALRQGCRRGKQERAEDRAVHRRPARQRAGHGAADRARPHRHGRLLQRRRGAADAGNLAARPSLLLQGRRRAGLHARQPHDQAGQRCAGEEGREVSRLDRGRHRRRDRQEALRVSRRTSPG